MLIRNRRINDCSRYGVRWCWWLFFCSPLASHAVEASCGVSTALLREQQAMLTEINLARANPGYYAEIIERYFSDLDEHRIYVRDGQQILMQEGRPAVDEAIAFLRKVRPRAALRMNSCLSLAAQDHVVASGARGLTGHVGADGSNPSERAARRVGHQAYCGENISYGAMTAREHVIALLVDDGVASRGHRANLFNQTYHSLGIGIGAHAVYQQMTVHLLCIDEPDDSKVARDTVR